MCQLFRDPAPWCEMDSLLFFPCVGIPTHLHGNMKTWRNKAEKLLLYYSTVQFEKADITMVPVNASIVVGLSGFLVQNLYFKGFRF